MANLTLGVDPIRVQVALPRWARVRKWLTREDPISRIRVLPHAARIDVDGPDEGAVDVSLWIANFSKRSIIPQHLDLTHWSWLSHVLPDLAVTTRGLGAIITPRSLATLHVGIQLNTAAIRRIREASPADVSHAIGANWGFNIHASLFFQNLKRPVQCHLEILNLQLRFYWYDRPARPNGP